ncbi:MAG: T9SS type A sorting domain-containing protein [Paludibacteraceae bacterium]|nr:T9SS type A sorting domain-containing protein [Paludibacteraceae bacterium]
MKTITFKNKSHFLLLVLSLLLACLFENSVFAAGFTSGNLVVVRVGSGSAALSSVATPVYLDEYTPLGSFVQSIEMPKAVSGSNKRFMLSGSATSEGALSLSANGKYLVFGGYDADSATTGVASTASATVNRVVARVDASGDINATTALTDFSTANNIRSVTSVDGSAFWLSGGATGIAYATLGATTSTQLNSTLTNVRVLEIFGGQLYFTTGSGSAYRLGTVGSGLPTASGQTLTNLTGIPTSGSPYAYVMFDEVDSVSGQDVLYLADDAKGILKYSLVSGSWTQTGSITATGVRGLTGVKNNGKVTLYASTATSVFSVVDSTGYNGTLSGSLTTRVTVATNEAFRGIAFAPTADTTSIPTGDALTSKDNRVQISFNGNVVTIDNLTESGTAEVLDLSGRVCQSFPIQSRIKNTLNLNEKQGVYIIKVVTDITVVAKKIVVR